MVSSRTLDLSLPRSIREAEGARSPASWCFQVGSSNTGDINDEKVDEFIEDLWAGSAVAVGFDRLVCREVCVCVCLLRGATRLETEIDSGPDASRYNQSSTPSLICAISTASRTWAVPARCVLRNYLHTRAARSTFTY